MLFEDDSPANVVFESERRENLLLYLQEREEKVSRRHGMRYINQSFHLRKDNGEGICEQGVVRI